MSKKQEIGPLIRRLRLQNKMTQAELAKAIGQSASSITMYETGRRFPDYETLEALADVFNVPLVLLNPEDMEAAEPVNEPTADSAPKTVEARIVSFGMDQLPKEDREQLLNVFHLWCSKHPDLFVKKDKKGDDDNEA